MFSLWILIIWAPKIEHMNFRCSGLEVLNGLQFKPDSALNIKLHFISLFMMFFFFVCFFQDSKHGLSLMNQGIGHRYNSHLPLTPAASGTLFILNYSKTNHELPQDWATHIYKTRPDKRPSRVRDRYILNPGIILSNHLWPATTPLTQPTAYMQG